jgi:hypothetical protein
VTSARDYQTRTDGEASPYRFRVMAGDEAEETLSPAASLFDVEAPASRGPRRGRTPGVGEPGLTPPPTGGDTGSNPVPGDNAPAASTPWSRIVVPGHTACDGFPRCPFEGTGDDLKAHQRECRRSEVGDLYRVLRGVA